MSGELTRADSNLTAAVLRSSTDWPSSSGELSSARRAAAAAQPLEQLPLSDLCNPLQLLPPPVTLSSPPPITPFPS